GHNGKLRMTVGEQPHQRLGGYFVELAAEDHHAALRGAGDDLPEGACLLENGAARHRLAQVAEHRLTVGGRAAGDEDCARSAGRRLGGCLSRTARELEVALAALAVARFGQQLQPRTPIRRHRLERQLAHGLHDEHSSAMFLPSERCRSCRPKGAVLCRPARPTQSVFTTRYGVAMDADAAGVDRPIDVIIADDHTVVRDGIRAVLERERGEFRVVAEAADVPSTVREVREHKPDLLTLDLTMPGGSSLAALPSCFIAHPPLAVAILTMREDPEYARQALRAGARSYVLKEAEPAELLQAFRLAVSGG